MWNLSKEIERIKKDWNGNSGDEINNYGTKIYWMNIMAIKLLMILKKIFTVSNREKKIEEAWTELQRPVG